MTSTVVCNGLTVESDTDKSVVTIGRTEVSIYKSGDVEVSTNGRVYVLKSKGIYTEETIYKADE